MINKDTTNWKTWRWNGVSKNKNPKAGDKVVIKDGHGGQIGEAGEVLSADDFYSVIFWPALGFKTIRENRLLRVLS